MIQGFLQLNKQIQKINSELDRPAPIQKIQSTPTTFCIRIRVPGETLCVHIGRGRGVEGLWSSEKPPQSEVRIRDRFNDWLNKNFKGQMLFGIEVDPIHRIFKFKMKRKDEESYVLFFYKGRRLYFAKIIVGEENQIFRSWVGKKESFGKEVSSEDVFVELYDGSLPQTESSSFDLVEHYSSLVKTRINNRKKKLLTKKVEELNTKIQKIDTAKSVQAQISYSEIEDIKNFFKGLGLKIKEKNGESVHQFRDRAFTKIKNFKNSKEFLVSKLEIINKERENVKNFKELKKTNLPEWGDPKKVKNKNNIVIYKINNISFAYGKNVKGNDYLRNKFGGSADTWFHLEGEKSCHLVIKCKLDEIKQSVLEIIGSVIKDATNYKGEEVSLIASKLGDIRGISGKAGAVTMKNPYYFKVLYNPDWKEIISSD